LCKEAFLPSDKVILAELERIKSYLEKSADIDLYGELTRQRRILFSDNLAGAVDKLFGCHVHRVLCISAKRLMRLCTVVGKQICPRLMNG